MQQEDLYKTNPRRKAKAFIGIAFLALIVMVLWWLGGFRRTSGLFEVSFYVAGFALLTVPRVFMAHIVRGGDSDPLEWYLSPFVLIVPALLLCFYYMFW